MNYVIFQGYARTKFHSQKIREREKVFETVAEKSARAELLVLRKKGEIF